MAEAPRPSSTPFISVVVPTYRSGEAFGRLLTSLRDQTLPAERFEVLVIDDGSPEPEAAAIAKMVGEQPNARFHRIAHTGWPSAPRNTGIDLARGEYILFVDHDDELYPGSLATAVETLQRTGADVFAGKEARTDQAKWALDAFDGNHDDASERLGVHPLIPTNPHKAYRTSMLRDHGIRFPEAGRQLWEDVIFNADVARHMRGVSIRSDEPFYHWVREQSTTSTTFGADLKEWWDALERIIRHIDAVLGSQEDAGQRDQLLVHQFRERVLPAVGPGLLRRPPEDRAFVLDRARSLVDGFLAPRMDQRLTRHLAARAHLLRLGRTDLVEALASFDDGILGITFALASRVDSDDGPSIRLETKTLWTAHHGGFLDLVVDGDHVRRALPDHLAAELGDDLLLLDREIAAASTRIGLRSRDTKMTWLVPTETSVTVDPASGYPDVTARSVAVLTPEALRHGRPMAAGRWDFNARNELFGVVNQRAVRAIGRFDRNPNGRQYHVYSNIHANLSLHVRP
ncbi:glycosyltransferase family 2 protein [Agromyces salentinus]|uniref:Glycosyltransferase family 2 protein n=1 Tax=Agromyces salentinus TaxID=269421 RepID=A0ABN2MVX4_9MICO|nr:glycosyltransferase family 2 protein [Agromyces salentinus]